MSLAISGDTLVYLTSLGLSDDQLKGLIDRLQRDALELSAKLPPSNEERERIRNESTYAERKRAKDRERRAREREELRQLKASAESPATTPASTGDYDGEAAATEGDQDRDHGDPAPRTYAQVVKPTSSLRSEGNPPVEPIGSTAPKGAEKARGTRLPDDWRPDEAGWTYAVETLGPNIDPARELDRFLDYWRAVPGAKGRKADWPATWRNWCRNAADNLARRAHAKPHRPDQPTTRADRRGVWAEVLAEERGEGPGFPPGSG